MSCVNFPGAVWLVMKENLIAQKNVAKKISMLQFCDVHVFLAISMFVLADEFHWIFHSHFLASGE
jgi:hypothetical protein